MLFLINCLLKITYKMFLTSSIIYTLMFFIILFIYKFKNSVIFRRSFLIKIITALITTIVIISFRYLINYLDDSIIFSYLEEISIIFSITLLRIYIREIVTILIDNSEIFITIKPGTRIDINDYKKPIFDNINTSDINPDNKLWNNDYERERQYLRDNNVAKKPDNTQVSAQDQTLADNTQISAQDQTLAEWKEKLSKRTRIENDMPKGPGVYNFRDKCLVKFSTKSGGKTTSLHLSGIKLYDYSNNQIERGYNKNDFSSNQPTSGILGELFEYLYNNNKKFIGKDLLNDSPKNFSGYLKDCLPSIITQHGSGAITKELINRLRRS